MLAYVVRMIRYSVGDDSVARLVLDRPEAKNALSIEMRDEIVARVRQVRADNDVRALLVTGVDDAFCAGMDLRASTVSKAGGSGFDPRAPARPFASASRRSSASCGSSTSPRWPR